MRIREIRQYPLKLFQNKFYSFSIIDEADSSFYIKDEVSGQIYSNDSYQYFFCIRQKTFPSVWNGFRGDEPVMPSLKASKLKNVKFQLKSGQGDSKTLEINGELTFGRTVKDIFHIKQEFIFSHGKDYFEEIIHVQKEGSGNYEVDSVNFGFNFKVRDNSWLNDMDKLRVVGVPFRKKPTGELNDFSLWELLNKIQFGEGWVITSGKQGLLINKYSQDMIETSAIGLTNNESMARLRFGGVYFSGWQVAKYDRPRQKRSDHTIELEKRLNSNQKISFGLTRHTFFKGGWKEGYKKYRSFLISRGHKLPENYQAKIFMNAYYNLAIAKYDRKQIENYVTKGKEVGAEFLYLDPQWNVEMAGEIWNEKKLGKAEKFAQHIQKKYNMGVGLFIMGSYHPSIEAVCTAEHGGDPTKIKRVSEKEVIENNRKLFPEGSLRIDSGGNECWDFCYCSSAWKEEKTNRLLKLAKAGIKYMPFDFHPWEGPCYAKNHGHSVPGSIEDHCKGLLEVVQSVHRDYPDITIEFHDPISGGVADRPTPLYYMHGLPYSYDEIWAFEFMDSPLVFLLNGQALSLYYYNLCYEVPLCLHFNMEQDNENCLGFWWYASTVRHLGFGGFNNLKQMSRYARAIKTYKRFRKFFTNGRFSGLDEMTHIHALDNSFIVMVFNITNKTIHKRIKINLSEIGLSDFTAKLKVESKKLRNLTKWNIKRNILDIDCLLGPMQPLLIQTT